MKELFNRKYSDRPTWLCLVVTAIVLLAAYIVCAELAGVVDLLAGSTPIQATVYDLPEDASSIDLELSDYIAKKAERGTYSYYLEAYLFELHLEMVSLQAETADVQEDYNKELIDDEQVENYIIEAEAAMDNLGDRVFLSILTSGLYRVLSIVLASRILMISTGLGTKIQYHIATKKLRWLF